MIRLAIFDCDGVLVDSERISCRVMAEVLTGEGLPATTADCMRDYMGRSWGDSLGLIEAKLGRPVGDGFTESFRARRDAALTAEVRAVEGVREAIGRIGIDRCVASSGAEEKIRMTLGLTGLLELFEGAIFSAAQVERGKPHPDLFLHAAAAMGHPPADCAVIEDTPVGVGAARAAGMTAFGYSGSVDAGQLAEAGARPFAHMRELPALLAGAG